MAQQSGDIDLRAKDRFETNRRFDEMELPRPDRPPVVVVPSIPGSDALAAGSRASEGAPPSGLAAAPTLSTGFRRSARPGQWLRRGLLALLALVVATIATVIGFRSITSVQSQRSESGLPQPVVLPEVSRGDEDLPVEVAASPDSVAETEALPETEPALTQEPPADVALPEQAAPEDENASASFEAALANVDMSEIVFLAGTGQLTDMGIQAVDDLAQVLLLDPDRAVEVAVSTFSETTPGQNHGLSVAQAATIIDRLIQAGVDPTLLRGVGLGSSDSQRPELAGAILFGANDPGLRAELAQLGPLTFTDTPIAGAFGRSFTDRQRDYLVGVADVAADNTDSTVDIVAYAWTESSADANHELSHVFADTAVAVLASSGIALERMTTVGLGERPISVGRMASAVTVHGDESAAVSIALSQVEVDAVTFEPSSAVLTESAERVLDRIVELTTLNPAVHLEVASHTYSQATSQANHDLSDRQSRAVRDYLVSHGVDPHQLESVAHGDPAHFGLRGLPTVTTFTVVR